MLDLATLHRRARRVLPIQIDTCRVVPDAAGEAGLAALLVPLGHRRRGAVLFELSSATLAALAAGSLAFLQYALTAREGLGRRTAPLVYREWEQVSHGPSMSFRTTSRNGHARLQLGPAAGLAMYLWDDQGLDATPAWQTPQ